MRLSDEELKNVNGGSEGHFTNIYQCPPETRACNDPSEWPEDKGVNRHCPYCGSSAVHDRFLFVPDWQACFEGQECDSCDKAWRTHSRGIA